MEKQIEKKIDVIDKEIAGKIYRNIDKEGQIDGKILIKNRKIQKAESQNFLDPVLAKPESLYKARF